MLYTSWS